MSTVNSQAMVVTSDSGVELRYSDGIAAARTLIALAGNATALQRRLPSGWMVAPYSGDDLRGKSFRGANMLVPFHEVYAVDTHAGIRVVFLNQATSLSCLRRATTPLARWRTSTGGLIRKIPQPFRGSIATAR
jgi:hypothetical protein